jgi:hypothetical protein
MHAQTLTYNQGCVIRRIRIMRRIVFNAYFTVLNKSGRIIRLQNLPFLAFLPKFLRFEIAGGLESV